MASIVVPFPDMLRIGRAPVQVVDDVRSLPGAHCPVWEAHRQPRVPPPFAAPPPVGFAVRSSRCPGLARLTAQALIPSIQIEHKVDR